MDSWNPPQIVRFSSRLIFFVLELIVLLIPSETDMSLGALHVLDDGVDREKTMRSGFISPHPVSFKAGTLSRHIFTSSSSSWTASTAAGSRQ